MTKLSLFTADKDDAEPLSLTVTREQILDALRDGSVVVPMPVVALPEDPEECECPEPPEEPPVEPEEPEEPETPEEPEEPEEPETPDEPTPPPGDDPPGTPTIADVVAYRGITVRFSEPVEIYTSITGCPCVRGVGGKSVTVVEYTPAWNGTLNGAVLNPRYDHGGQSYATGANYKHFVAAHHAKVPIALKPGDKLLIVWNYTEADATARRDGVAMSSFGVRPNIRECFPLVVLKDRPPAEFFRPGLAADGDATPVPASRIRFDWIEAVKLKAPSTGIPDIATLLARVTPPWGAYSGAQEANGLYTTWQSSYHVTKSADYGRERCVLVGEALLAALCDISPADKRALTAAIVQQGIDAVSIARTGSAANPVRWGHSRGGIGSGFAPQAFFYAILAGDESARALFAGNRDLVLEFSQTAVLTPELAPNGYTAVRNGQRYDSPAKLGDIIWADSTVPVHRMNSSNWVAYRWCCNANSWQGMALFAYALTKFVDEVADGPALFGHAPFFAYMDIHNAEAKRLGKADWERGYTPFLRGMWDANRAAIGPEIYKQ